MGMPLCFPLHDAPCIYVCKQEGQHIIGLMVAEVLRWQSSQRLINILHHEPFQMLNRQNNIITDSTCFPLHRNFVNTALVAALRVAGVGYTRNAITAGDRAQEQLAFGDPGYGLAKDRLPILLCR